MKTLIYFWKLIRGSFCKHEVEFIRELNILAKGKCVKCGMLLCCNRQLGSCMPWKDSWDFEFDRMER